MINFHLCIYTNKSVGNELSYTNLSLMKVDQVATIIWGKKMKNKKMPALELSLIFCTSFHLFTCFKMVKTSDIVGKSAISLDYSLKEAERQQSTQADSVYLYFHLTTKLFRIRKMQEAHTKK